MLWAYDDNGYLISVDLPRQARCRMCGVDYTRAIEYRKPWQADVPDACPKCGYVSQDVHGIAFHNAIC